MNCPENLECPDNVSSGHRQRATHDICVKALGGGSPWPWNMAMGGGENGCAENGIGCCCGFEQLGCMGPEDTDAWLLPNCVLLLPVERSNVDRG